MKAGSLRYFLLWPFALSLAACDGGSSGNSDSVRSSANDDRDAPTWQIDYSGDLSGRIEGNSLLVLKIGTSEHQNFTVRTISNNPGLSATLGLINDTPTGFLNRVTLEDGTVCTPSDESDVTILDSSKETFHATVKGQLRCGEAKDQFIDFEAVIQDR